MKKLVVGSMLLASIGVSHADLLAAKGTKATVTVEYSYAAIGTKKDKYDPREWKVNRTVSLSAQFAADKPQEMAQMRAPEAAQTADLQNKQKLAKSASTKMAPMMGDMMKIYGKCGDNEACITKAVESYGNSMEMTPELKSAGDDIKELGKTSGPRYQVWKAVSQKGTYFIDEYYKAQTADPLCMEKPKQRCNREETRKGNGEIPSPPGKSGASGAMFEVDAQKKDIVMTLPMTMAPLTYQRDVKSDFPGEAGGNSQGTTQLGALAKPLTVTIPGDLRSLSGTEQMKIDGAEGEGGTLTVKWTIAVL